MREFTGFEKGIGLGGWLTNFKRLRFIPIEQSTLITVGDREHFERYLTEEDFRRIASWGLDHVRLPFDYTILEREEALFQYTTWGFELLERGIFWCRRNRLNVVLDLHRAPGSSCEYASQTSLFANESCQERFVRLWEELARRFRGCGDFLAFELLNEVATDDAEVWNRLAERTIRAIRKIDPARVIVVGSAAGNHPSKLKGMRVFDDEKIVYSFHSYDPVEFTHQQGPVNPVIAVYNRAMNYPDSVEKYRDFRKFSHWDDCYGGVARIDRNFLEGVMAEAFAFGRRTGQALYCGEFGVIRNCDPVSRENYCRDIIGLCLEHRIAYSIWNYLSTPYDANRFSLADDVTREPLSEELLRIMRGEATDLHFVPLCGSV